MIASLIGFVVLFLLAFSGVPLAFAMLLVGTGGFALLRGGFEPAFSMVAQQVMDASANDGMSVLPMFILMGLFVHKADLSEELYKAANAWLGHLRGGLQPQGYFVFHFQVYALLFASDGINLRAAEIGDDRYSGKHQGYEYLGVKSASFTTG